MEHLVTILLLKRYVISKIEHLVAGEAVIARNPWVEYPLELEGEGC